MKLSWLPALILITDQATKYFSFYFLRGSDITLISGILELTYITNTGSLFSILQGATTFLLLLSMIVIGIVVYEIPHEKGLWKTGFLVVLGGALGNTLDRLLLGHVIDFIHIRMWPVFNIADCAITIGIGILLYAYVQDMKTKKRKKKKNSKKQQSLRFENHK